MLLIYYRNAKCKNKVFVKLSDVERAVSSTLIVNDLKQDTIFFEPRHQKKTFFPHANAKAQIS